MKATISIQTEYGFAHYWSLVVTKKSGESRSLFLGQDVKFCSRVLGLEPSYIIEQIGANDMRQESTRVRLANFILKHLGVKKSEVFNFDSWALSAE